MLMEQEQGRGTGMGQKGCHASFFMAYFSGNESGGRIIHYSNCRRPGTESLIAGDAGTHVPSKFPESAQKFGCWTQNCNNNNNKTFYLITLIFFFSLFMIFPIYLHKSVFLSLQIKLLLASLPWQEQKQVGAGGDVGDGKELRSDNRLVGTTGCHKQWLKYTLDSQELEAILYLLLHH